MKYCTKATNILVYLSHFGTDFVLFINGKHIRDFPSIEKVSNVFQEILLFDLCVGEEKDGRVTFCSLAENLFEVLSPFHRGVAFANLNL